VSLLHEESFPAYGRLDSPIRTGSSFLEGVTNGLVWVEDGVLEHLVGRWRELLAVA
jgi:hypothetical protein